MPVVVLRLLLPLLAALTITASSVTAYAAAGMIGEPECCCPVKAKCKCHDHDGKPTPTATVKRCGGTAKLVAPVITPVVATPVTCLVDVARTLLVQPATAAAIPDDHALEIETPPF